MQISEIKKDAKIKLTGNYLKCASSSLLYFIITGLFTYFQEKLTNKIANDFLLAIVQAIFLIVYWCLNYGLISNIIDLVDLKTNSITDFINITLIKSGKFLKIGLFTLLKILIPIIVSILSIFYYCGTKVAEVNNVNFLCFNKNFGKLSLVIVIITLIILIYYLIKYSLIAYIFHDNPDLSEKEIVNKSNELMKENKKNYILLLLSFFHWFLLGALILLILNNFIDIKYSTPFMILFYSILRPYIIISKNEFYHELIDLKNKNS